MVTQQEFEKIAGTEIAKHGTHCLLAASLIFKTELMRTVAFEALMYAASEELKRKILKDTTWKY